MQRLFYFSDYIFCYHRKNAWVAFHNQIDILLAVYFIAVKEETISDRRFELIPGSGDKEYNTSLFLFKNAVLIPALAAPAMSQLCAVTMSISLNPFFVLPNDRRSYQVCIF
jgi:hypothetical protein